MTFFCPYSVSVSYRAIGSVSLSLSLRLAHTHTHTHTHKKIYNQEDDVQSPKGYYLFILMGENRIQLTVYMEYM